LTKNAQRFASQRRFIGRLEVESYNHAIYRQSEDQIYSNDKGYLESLVSIGKHLLLR
jgi:hypothetical protein